MANDAESNHARQLLEALYDQRAELGEVATELISLLTAAGVGMPARANDRSGGSSPVDGVSADHDGAN